MKLAIIPARGQSKRIPRKNIRSFCGRPILEYSIDAALNSGLFDDVMVSTDDDEIASLACAAGASVPFLRSQKAASDEASTAELLLEVLTRYRALGKTYSTVCCLYPTAPFVTPKILLDSSSLFYNSGADALIPVVAFSYPPLRGCVVGQDGRLTMKWPENALVRSQDLPTLYHDSGQFYFLNTDAFERQKTLFMENTLPYYMEETQVQDIDTETDWKLAEMKFRLLQDASQDTQSNGR